MVHDRLPCRRMRRLLEVPCSPELRYWMAFNDHQISVSGDPFIGGARGVNTVRTELLLSGAPALLEENKALLAVVDGMTFELEKVGRDTNSVFLY